MLVKVSDLRKILNLRSACKVVNLTSEAHQPHIRSESGFDDSPHVPDNIALMLEKTFARSDVSLTQI